MREGITVDLPSSSACNRECSLLRLQELSAGNVQAGSGGRCEGAYRRHLGLSVRQAHKKVTHPCCPPPYAAYSRSWPSFAFAFAFALVVVVKEKKSSEDLSQLRVLSSASSARGRIGTTPLCFPPFQFLHTSHLDPILQSASPRCASRAGTGFTAASRWALGMGGGMNVWRA